MRKHNLSPSRLGSRRRWLAWPFAVSGLLVLSCSSSDDVRERTQGLSLVEVPEGTSSLVAPQLQAETTCMYPFDSLDVLQVVQSGSSFYVQIRHRSAAPAAQPEEAPKITVKAVAATTEKAVGGMGKVGGAGTGWVAIPVGDVPVGQSEVTVKALGLTATVPVVKNATGQVQYLPLAAREGLIWSDDSVGVPSDDSVKVEVW